MWTDTMKSNINSEKELLDKIYDSNRIKLSKWVRKYRRWLKQQARTILGLTSDEILELFKVKEINIEKDLDKIKTIEFNEIKWEWEVYEWELGDYQMEVIQKIFDFDWGDKIKIEWNEDTNNPTWKYLKLIIKKKDIFLWELSFTNTYNWLDYLWRDIPKEWTELFLVSKILEKNLKQIIHSIYDNFKYNNFLVDKIRWNIDWEWNKTINYSNNDIYSIINNDTRLGNSLDTFFSEISKYIYFIKEISTILKEKYPDFQEPIVFDENWFNAEEYKRWLVYDAIKEIRKEYTKKSREI